MPRTIRGVRKEETARPTAASSATSNAGPEVAGATPIPRTSRRPGQCSRGAARAERPGHFSRRGHGSSWSRVFSFHIQGVRLFTLWLPTSRLNIRPQLCQSRDAGQGTWNAEMYRIPRRGLRKLSPDLISKARDETATQVTRIGLTFLGSAA